jgi:hypothetical protein
MIPVLTIFFIFIVKIGTSGNESRKREDIHLQTIIEPNFAKLRECSNILKNDSTVVFKTTNLDGMQCWVNVL